MAKKEFSISLEGLRGFAAAGVVVSHLFYYNQDFDKSYCPVILKSLLPFAHIEVLIFFVLSGFVIGLSHPSRMQGSEVKTYIKKRLLRIYPIYFIGILLALIVSGFHYDGASILSNFTLTQNIARLSFHENNPAWSINYEMLYYLLFIPISFFEIKPVVAFLVSLFLGAINIYLHTPPLITSYFLGFCFWLSGLLIARNFKGNIQVNFLPFLFYILSLSTIPLGISIKSLLGHIRAPLEKQGNFAQIAISIDDLVILPFCFMIVLFFSGRTFRGKNILFGLISLLPAASIVHGILQHNQDTAFIFGIVYFILFLVFLPLPAFRSYPIFNDKIKTGLAALGSVSYGLYIIHFPILCLFGHLTFPGSPVVSYWIKVVLFFLAVALVSWILEKKFQPWIKTAL